MVVSLAEDGLLPSTFFPLYESRLLLLFCNRYCCCYVDRVVIILLTTGKIVIF